MVNTEYQRKTGELSNFLSSTMISILFVDRKLSIRKFTDRIFSYSFSC